MILPLCIFLFLFGIGLLLSIQKQSVPLEAKPKPKQPLPPQPLGFVPTEAERVPSHAHYSNKFNDIIGNETSGIIGEGQQEIVIPSDWYMSRYLPTEFDGDYWPRGSIEPDFIFPGSDPKRPLRPQTLYASQILSLGKQQILS